MTHARMHAIDASRWEVVSVGGMFVCGGFRADASSIGMLVRLIMVILLKFGRVGRIID